MHESDGHLLTESLRLYHKDASILLLGCDGAGKKTLGIIASIALKRQYVDFTQFFVREIGCTPHQFITLNQPDVYYDTLSKVLQSLLDKHSLSCVIGGLPQSGAKYQKELLKSFATTHPVIYIQRARSELEILSKRSKKTDLLYLALDAFQRECSNFDYYNITQKSDGSKEHATSTLKLKKVEADFVRFVHRVLGLTQHLSHSNDPFSASYTYALCIEAKQLEESFDTTALECGADAINLIVSPMDKNLRQTLVRQMAMLRRMTKLPIIIDVQEADSSLYLTALRVALRVLPDIMTVNLAADSEVVNALSHTKGFIKLIGTFHHQVSWENFQESMQFFKLQRIATRFSLDALRISAQAVSRDDNLGCFEFAHLTHRTLNIPVTAYNTGLLGRNSICFNRILSPVVTPPSDEGVTIHDARSARYASFMIEPLKFSVFGSNVSYTLAPAMHNAAFRACGIPYSLDYYQSDKVEDMQLLLDRMCGGFTVTMPFKTTVLSSLDFLSPEAQRIGAVNTVVIDRTSGATVLKGHNTDHIGIRQSLANHLSPANSIRGSSTALILGAGGMARAAMYALQTLEVKNICICNRTRDHALALAKSNPSVHVLDISDAWPSRLEQPTMIISAIPADHVNDVPAHELDIPDEWLKSATGGTFIEVSDASRSLT